MFSWGIAAVPDAMDDFNLHQSPTEPQANLGISALFALLCFGMHAFAIARWYLFFAATIQIDAVVAVLLVATTVIGLACSISALRQGGLANRIVGLLGMLWFGFYVLLAIVTS
jgi:hypothetical protein